MTYLTAVPASLALWAALSTPWLVSRRLAIAAQQWAPMLQPGATRKTIARYHLARTWIRVVGAALMAVCVRYLWLEASASGWLSALLER